MPAFTAVGAYVAGTLLGLAGTAAVVVGSIVAVGAAYVTSRVINGNPNKGANAAQNQGGRIQVPPATNNKIPVVYGNAYVNGIITDARFKTYGCGSAIASSSLITEMVKGMTLDQAGSIKNSEIAEELALPPVKIHCSILAEDAIKAAVADYKTKHTGT